MSVPPGWSADPYGRFAQRYWDGALWTAHVVDSAGVQVIDPLGTSMSVPFAMPASAVSAGAPKRSFFAVPQPASPVRNAFAALGAAVLAAGLAAIILGDRPNRGAAALLGLLYLAAAVLIGVKASAHRAAAASLLTVGIVLVSRGILNRSWSWFAFLAAVLALIAWSVPPFRKHPFLLAAGVFGLLFAIGNGMGARSVTEHNNGLFFLAGGTAVAYAVYRLERAELSVYSAALLVAAALLALRGAGVNPLLAPAALQRGLSAQNTGGLACVAVAGAVLAFVGARGNHRLMMLLGVALTGAGSTAFLVRLFDADGARAVGGAGLFVGLMVLVVPFLWSAYRSARGPAGGTPGG